MADGDYTIDSDYVGGFNYGNPIPPQGGQGTPMPPPPTPPANTQPYTPPPASPPTPAYNPIPAYGVPQAPQNVYSSNANGGVMGDMGGNMGNGGIPGDQNPPFDPNYVFGARMQSFTTTIKLPQHNLKVDENKFINLLAGSISLSKDEKKRIIDSIPKLRQEQVDELIRIFEEERAKFIELSPKHGAQLKKLEDEHAADWRDLEMEYKAAGKKEEESAKAEEIRKQLGI